jgi:predicted RNA polymerase sigma factor
MYEWLSWCCRARTVDEKRHKKKKKKKRRRKKKRKKKKKEKKRKKRKKAPNERVTVNECAFAAASRWFTHTAAA